MKKIDFSNYKFRASSIKKLMTRSRSKGDPLSVTTKSYLQEIFIEEVFGRKKEVSTAPMKKGTIVETDSMVLVQNVTGNTYFKNNKQLENDFISGTPDIRDSKNKAIRDIKSSWDLWTFTKITEKVARSAYYYQMLGYMWLDGVEKAFLHYALVNTPEEIMHSESSKLAWSMGDEEAENYIRKNHTFDDIDEKIRLKEYVFDFSQDDVDAIKEKVILSREFLNNYSL